MNEGSGPIASLWMTEDAERTGGLDTARLCSSLTDPATLPPIAQVADQKLPETFQDIGALGLANMEGKFAAALFPVDFPWFELDLASESLYDPSIPDERKQAVRQRLFLLKLQITATIESAGLSEEGRYSGMAFRSHKRNVINSILVTGEALEHIDDNYRFRMFRRDQYVTRRDHCGDVVYHVIRENKDPLTLQDTHFAKSGLKRDELKDKGFKDRCQELYTKVEWSPNSKKWTVTQEMNGHTINEFDEPVPSYFCTPFRLVVGENYGRGYVEKLSPSLRTLNELEIRRLDMLAAASRVNPCIDFASQVRDTDLAKPSGRVIRCKVVGGVPQDVGFLGYPNIREFQMLTTGIDQKYTALARSFLLESQTIPNQDRVTRFQVLRIAQELEGITGGFYVPVAESQQIPQLRRVLWQMQRDKLMKPLPEKAVRIEAFTGVAALARANKAADLLEYTQAVAALGPEAMARINTGVLAGELARMKNIDVPGLVKSEEQIAKERQEMMMMAAQQKAIDVTGNIVENQAAAQQAPA